MKRPVIEWNFKLKECDVCYTLFKPLNGKQLRCSKKCILYIHKVKYDQTEERKAYWESRRKTTEYKKYHTQYSKYWVKTPYGILYTRAMTWRRLGYKDVTREYLVNLYRETTHCVMCGVELGLCGNSPHLDHIIPLNIGGKHEKENLRIVCRTCNLTRPKNGSDLLQI